MRRTLQAEGVAYPSVQLIKGYNKSKEGDSAWFEGKNLEE